MIHTRITDLFGINTPIIQGGMIWVSGHELAAAVSEAGGLGLLGSGSMYPDELRKEIQATRALTQKPFGVNVPLLRPDVEKIVAVVLEEKIPIVFTSAGNPRTFTEQLKQNGAKVVHVVPSVRFALKAEAAGVDAIVAEGTEAGGHNGFEEITTFCLIPQVVEAVSVPVMAAGGIGDGRGLAAALALGAEGVQIGTRFALTRESAAHLNYKNAGLQAGEADTLLFARKVGPIRAFKNEFARRIWEAEFAGAPPEKIREMIGSRRAKWGIHEGDMKEGDLEMGQIAGLVKDIPSAGEVVRKITADAEFILKRLNHLLG
ncbi:MAG: nitronate monooxygenase [Calditrichaeota bacterium]|nr:nitronate monooxygenase [Calditrichota bacterium]